MNPLADTQNIKRNSTSECLYLEQIVDREASKKRKKDSTIAFAKQSGNNDKKK